MSGSPDIAPHYTNGEFTPFVQEARAAGSSGGGLIRVRQPAGAYPDPAVDALAVVLTENTSSTERIDHGAGAWRGEVQKGMLHAVAPNFATTVETRSESHLTVLWLPMPALRTVLAEDLPDFDGDLGPLIARPALIPRAERQMRALWAEGANSNPHGTLYGDGLILTLLAELLRASDRLRDALDETAPLDAERLRRAQELMDATLEDGLGLGTLAEAVGLSQFHFTRAFKSATGLTPHAYLLDRRLARAQDLLSRTELPLAEIAYACGFSSQSHMTSTFTKHLGLPPGRYRQEVRT